MSLYNVWFPTDQFFGYNSGITSTLVTLPHLITGTTLCRSFVMPNRQAILGIDSRHSSPEFSITKPPKISYASQQNMNLTLRDSAGWLWSAPMPAQASVQERGWAWGQFTLDLRQENTGARPTSPSVGNIREFLFKLAAGDTSFVFNLAYISGRSPTAVSVGSIKRFQAVDKNPEAHTWKIGNLSLEDGVRKPVLYSGTLPAFYQEKGPRSGPTNYPYRGPIVAGIQSGIPWATAGDNLSLGSMLDFLLESQAQFSARSPTGLHGPFMHSYLQALWDTQQNDVDSVWTWETTFGNPLWNGWQYRALELAARTWNNAQENPVIEKENLDKLKSVCTPFLDWLYEWLLSNEAAKGVPDIWEPDGYSLGSVVPSSAGLVPVYSGEDPHSSALVLKATVFASLSGYDHIKSHYIAHRLTEALLSTQVDGQTEMSGAFTLSPDTFDVSSTVQGEVMEALALAEQHSELFVSHLYPDL